MHEMDLNSGEREFWDVDDDSETEARMKSMTFKEKVMHHLRNW